MKCLAECDAVTRAACLVAYGVRSPDQVSCKADTQRRSGDNDQRMKWMGGRSRDLGTALSIDRYVEDLTGYFQGLLTLELNEPGTEDKPLTAAQKDAQDDRVNTLLLVRQHLCTFISITDR